MRYFVRTAVVIAITAFALPATGAVFTFDGSTSSDWTVADNWSTDPATPWDAPTAPADDLSVAASIEVNSTQTFTTGANSGNPFQVRRVGITGGNSVTITTGGTLDFGGANDSRFLLNNGSTSVSMTGGSLVSDQSNLGGIVLGNFSGFTVSGSSTINIADADGDTPGLFWSNTPDSAGPFHVIGSSADITLEQITFSGADPDAEFRFTLDSGGASALKVTNQIDFTTGGTVDMNIINSGFSDSTITLFELSNGVNGEFDNVITGAGTFSGAEGTQVEVLGAGFYTLTYDLNGNGDIGLFTPVESVPEPSCLVMLLAGMMLLPLRRRRLR